MARAVIMLGLAIALILVSGWDELTAPIVGDGYRQAVATAQALPDPHQTRLKLLLALRPLMVRQHSQIPMKLSGAPQAYIWLPQDVVRWEDHPATDFDPELIGVSLKNGMGGMLGPEATEYFKARMAFSNMALSVREPDAQTVYGTTPSVADDFHRGAPASAHPLRSAFDRKISYILPHFWALVPMILFLLMIPLGRNARERIREQLGKAARSGVASGLIGGVDWAVSGGKLFHHADAPWRTPAPDTEALQRHDDAGKYSFVRSILIFFLPFLLMAHAERGLPIHDMLDAVRPIEGIALPIILVWEFFYQRGSQWIPGAMVLDPRPQDISLEDVESQKAFGDAPFVPEHVAVAAASGQLPDRLPVHDQEF